MSETILFKNNMRLRRRMHRAWFREKELMVKELIKAMGKKPPKLEPYTHTPKSVIKLSLLRGVQI